MDVRDINGREVRPGDLIRAYHYRDRSTRRKCYLYFLVVLVDDNLRISKDGTHLYAVSIHDIWDQGSLEKAHKCSLSAAGPFEILDGLSSTVNGYLQCWYERPKVLKETDRTAADAAKGD